MDADKWCDLIEGDIILRLSEAGPLYDFPIGKLATSSLTPFILKNSVLDVTVTPCMESYTMKDKWFCFQEP